MFVLLEGPKLGGPGVNIYSIGDESVQVALVRRPFFHSNSRSGVILIEVREMSWVGDLAIISIDQETIDGRKEREEEDRYNLGRSLVHPGSLTC